MIYGNFTPVNNFFFDRLCVSVCPKHAALRCTSASQALHIMDLCSHGGVSLSSSDRSPIPPLEWINISTDDGSKERITFGDVECRLEITVQGKTRGSVSFFGDEDSADFIDCSLEEPPTKSSSITKSVQQTSNCSVSSLKSNNVSSLSVDPAESSLLPEGSFCIPATQQLDDTFANSSIPTSTVVPAIKIQVDKCTTNKKDNETAEEDDDDDMFFIPETQEINTGLDANESEIIEPIANTIGEGDKDDDFLRFETEDDENTGDGMFNNPFVEQSQNLLQNLDESYKRDERRKSIAPDRSVDSISFHGKLPAADETDCDLSKLVWSESRNTSKATSSVHEISSGSHQVPREGSVTPDLDFDRPPSAPKCSLQTDGRQSGRSNSVTPDLDFDRVSPNQEPVTATASKLRLSKSVSQQSMEDKKRKEEEQTAKRDQSVTPELNFDDENVEVKGTDEKKGADEEDDDGGDISLNQEGFVDPYDIATQAIVEAELVKPKKKKVPVKAPQPDANGLLHVGDGKTLIPFKSNFRKTSFKMMVLLRSGEKREITCTVPKQSCSAEELLEQVGIQSPRSADIQCFLVVSSNDDAGSIDCIVTAGVEAYRETAERALIKYKQQHAVSQSSSKSSRSLSRTSPNSSVSKKQKKSIDPFELATQLLRSPSRDEPADAYDLLTQALPQDDTVPLDLPSPSKSPEPTEDGDVYDLQTQPMMSNSFKVPSSSSYDLLTQKLSAKKLKEAKSLRKVAIHLTDLRENKQNKSMRRNKEMDLDAFVLETQPLQLEKPNGNVADDDDAYDLQTQPLTSHPNHNDTIPLDLGEPSPKKAKTVPTRSEDQDPYDLLTQPLKATASHASSDDGGDDGCEINGTFRPPANSTCRQSVLIRGIPEESDEESKEVVLSKDSLNISPSSEKENRVTMNQQRQKKRKHSKDGSGDKVAAAVVKRSVSSIVMTQESDFEGFSQMENVGDEDLDDDFCLAATIPIGGEESVKSSSSKTDVNEPEPVFKVPDNRTLIPSTSKNPAKGFETPKAKSRKPSSSRDSEDTLSFDFNTPEHPILKAASRENLAISDMIKASQKKADRVTARNKYIFGDSSDEDELPEDPVFKKQDSKIEVMVYDKDSKPAVKSREKKSANSNRTKKRKTSDETEEDNKSTSSSRSGRSTRSKTDSCASHTSSKSSVDESVDYQSTTSETKPTRHRKAKADEDTSTSSSTKPAKKEKIKPKDEIAPPPPPPAKRFARTKRAASTLSEASSEPKTSSKSVNRTAPVGRSKKTAKNTKLNTSTVLISSEDEEEESSATSASGATTDDGSESSGSRTRTRAPKPKLMFTKMSPEPYKQIITRAGGTIVDLPEMASVLVSDRVYRTYKFLCAIGKGIPIVGQPYLDLVQSERRFVDPWEHILQDQDMERRFKFNLKKSLTLAREAKLFQDYSVFVTPSTKPPPDELKLIVASAGGRVPKFPSQHPKYADKLFAISDVQDKDMWPKLRQLYPTIEIISTEGFMLSIMQHYKNFRNYRLT
ncbi:uncharacterized protein LOC129759826 [Uranotaenia lowii]|uniref:uncharacterized protein LOC129759826 n=1 Tax=Uranotaenia lowii TaxID=190385 RepID=UPI00247A0BB8|nr:uncharacterized protein LOC129759826 [Uranotaenia lowii]